MYGKGLHATTINMAKLERSILIDCQIQAQEQFTYPVIEPMWLSLYTSYKR